MKTIVIVGGGAAGLMAAISASGPGRKVILLERNEKVGKKLFITGKGRCNITNASDINTFFDHIPGSPRFMHSAFSKFSNKDIMNFFEERGVAVKTERGARVFPVSDKSSDVIRALLKTCQEKKVTIHYHCLVNDLLIDEEEKRVTGVSCRDGRSFQADAVVLACGGMSYPSTGSDGKGYALARKAGHRIIEPSPSLVPFECREKWVSDLMGLSLKNVEIQLKEKKKLLYKGFGEMLFTHFGVSGPLILTASTRLGRTDFSKAPLRLIIDFKPALDEEKVQARLLREFDTYRNKNISNVLDRLLPGKLTPCFLEYIGLDPGKKVRDISRKERNHIADALKNFELHITGTRSFNEAIITRGGVDVRQIDPSSMESRLISQLYFAGEMMNVDAETGGYNLQIAWSSGYSAGISCAK